MCRKRSNPNLNHPTVTSASLPLNMSDVDVPSPSAGSPTPAPSKGSPSGFLKVRWSPRDRPVAEKEPALGLLLLPR